MMQSALDPEQFHQGYLGFISQNFFSRTVQAPLDAFLKLFFLTMELIQSI